MLSVFCLFTVIGGKNVYLRLSVSGECDNKDSVREILQKEVLYSVVLRVFNVEKSCLGKTVVAGALMRHATHREGAEGGFLLLQVWSGRGVLPEENVENLHASRCNLVHFRPKRLLLRSLYTLFETRVLPFFAV